MNQEELRDYLARAAAMDEDLFGPISQELFTDEMITEFEQANLSIHNMFSFPEEWWRARNRF